MRNVAERAILLQEASVTDAVDEEISDQLFGGCFGVLLFFFLVSGGFILGVALLLQKLLKL